jgi:GDP/UDP-N,N'-diacetylbacillosamine 2-epimerase (hydrolysing)
LARPRYLGLLANADVLIGNSSSGIVEAASFGTPVINVGSRQNLRERNANILDVDGDPHRIEEALAAVLQAGRADRTNIYAHFSGERAADLIAARLASHPLQGLLAKVNAY